MSNLSRPAAAVLLAAVTAAACSAGPRRHRRPRRRLRHPPRVPRPHAAALPVGHRPPDRRDRHRPALRRGRRLRPGRVPRRARAATSRSTATGPSCSSRTTAAGRARDRTASAAARRSGPRKLTEDAGPGAARVRASDGGLAIARAEYQNPLVADAPTAVFRSMPTAATRPSRSWRWAWRPSPGRTPRSRRRWRSWASGSATSTAAASLLERPVLAGRLPGVLTEQHGRRGRPVRDVAVGGPSSPPTSRSPPIRTRSARARATLTPDEAAALGIDGSENGIQSGVCRDGADGKTLLARRPAAAPRRDRAEARRRPQPTSANRSPA